MKKVIGVNIPIKNQLSTEKNFVIFSSYKFKLNNIHLSTHNK